MPTNQLLIASRTMEKKSFQQCSISDNRRRGWAYLIYLRRCSMYGSRSLASSGGSRCG